MKKVIVSRENYEEVMFDLLENNYPREVEENILDQIHADTFLNFEWQQWSKAKCSESTEPYKTNEAEFIESLTKEEKKKGMFYYIFPAAVAASVALLVGIYFFYGKTSTVNNKEFVQIANPPEVDGKNNRIPDSNTKTLEVLKPENKYANKEYTPEKTGQPVPVKEISPEPIVEKQNNATLVEVLEDRQKEVPTFQDTIRAMIASAKKQPKYKITIVEENLDALDGNNYRYNEKRYSMADVLSRKDGISLSKFLENASSRIVTDSITHRVTIEYTAEDHSVLVLTLSK